LLGFSGGFGRDEDVDLGIKAINDSL
jgi:hypothetical protein